VDPWSEQEKSQPQANRNKKIGAFAVTAAIGEAAVALILGTSGEENSKTPAAEPSGVNYPADLSVANKFVNAFGALDGESSALPTRITSTSHTGNWR
jgi:hypothetical protein